MLPGPRRDFRNNFRKTTRLSELQQKNGQLIVEESNRLVDEVQWTTEQYKKEVDRRLDEQLKDIEFLREELQLKKRDAIKEEEALKVFKQRVEKKLHSIGELTRISRQVQEVRSKNPFARGTIDVADKALANELRVLEISTEDLQDCHENIRELIRKLRESIFELDNDLNLKDQVHDLDQLCKSMKETDLSLKRPSTGEDFKREGISMDNWNKLSMDRINRTRELIKKGTSIRSFTEIQLKEIDDTLNDHFHRTNEKFHERITEMKETKLRLENTLKSNLDHMNTVDRNLVNLDKELLGKQGFINLCTARLKTRTMRPGQELCEDSVQAALLQELDSLHKTVAKLKAQVEETNFSSKHLQAARLQLQGQISEQSRLIQLNEVDCMTLRANLQL